MPIHKNTVRQKKATFTFNGTYTRRDFEDSSSYLGLPQDIWVAGTYPNLSIAEDSLPLRFSGNSGGSERVETALDDEDSLVVMCMNNSDDAHEYDAEDVRDSALAALQATSGFNHSTGLAYTPTQLGTWTKYDEVYSDYTTYDLIWNPNSGNTAAFADDHPTGTNPVATHFINVLDTGETFSTTFEPTTAVYSNSADEVELVFPESPSSTALTNKYWAVGGRFGSNTDSTDIPQWTAIVTSRAQDGNVTRVVMKVTSGSAFLNTTALAAPASSGANSIISLFTGGKQFVVHVSVTNLYMVDQVNTANQGYTIEGVCTEADITGDIQVGVSTDSFNVLEMNLTTVTDVTSNFYDINNVPGSTMSGSTTINRIRFRPNNENPITGGGTFIFVNIPTSTGSSPLDKVTVAASILNDTTFRGIDVVATVSGTTNDATLSIRPRNTALNWTGVTEVEGSWVGSLTEASVSITSAVTLPLADDANRIGSNNIVVFEDGGYVSRTSNYGTLPIITFARGATLTLSNGFTMEVGKGYDFIGDAKDGLFHIKNNAKVVFSGQAKENLWGGKFKQETGGLTQDALIATNANPMTVIQESSGSISENIDTSLNAPVFGQRTFVVGRASAQGNQSLQWVVKNSQTGLYSGLSNNFFYPVPGAKEGQTIIFDSPTGVGIYEPSNRIKQFTGDSLIIGSNNNSFQLNGGTLGSASDAESFTYGSQWIAGGMKIMGLSTLGAFQPRNVNFTLFDLEDAEGIYTGGWAFDNRSVGTTGIPTLGRLWNPSWNYGGEALTKIYESYYYGTGSDETTLGAVKEGCEPEDINTAAANNHPFNDAITISSTNGLADVEIDGAGINLYKSDNDGTLSGWGDTISDYDGLMLVFAKGEKSLTTDSANTKLTTAQHATDWFCYSRRDGYRPRFITESFSGSLTSYQTVTQMEPFLDVYWQANTVSAIKVFTDLFETTAWSTVPVYTNGTTTLTVDLPTLTNANNLYRFIEYSENHNNITNANLTSETRPFSTINGRFRRFIDTDVPVTTGGDINMPDYNLDLVYNTALVRSTGSDPIRGIDVGTTHTIKLTPETSGENLIKLDLSAKSFTFDETSGDITAEDAVFTNVDAQTYPFDMESTVINSTGAPTLSGANETVTVNTNAATVISGVSTDTIVNGTGAVSISANSTDGRYGTSSSKLASITYSSSAVSINDTGHTSGNLALPNVNTDANFNVEGNITRAGTTGTTTDADLTATGSVEVNAIDGGNVTTGSTFRARGSLASTTIQATGNVTLDANATGSSGIGINGNAISIGGNTSSCEVNAVTTFVTNDVADGSDVSAGTSATVEEVSATLTAPIVACDYIRTGAAITASTSLDASISMTGGAVTSPTVDIDVDLTGGTVNCSGTLTVPTISGSTTTANAGKLVATTFSSGFINLSGLLSTITTVSGGIIDGTTADRTLTIANRITGGSFSNVKLLSVPTNTSATKHLGSYTSTNMEMTNSGIVEFDASATGVAVITAGPSSGTVVVSPGGVTFTIAEDDGSNNTDNVSFSSPPFSVTVDFPSGGLGAIKHNSTITTYDNVDIVLTESDVTRGDVIEVAWIKPGSNMVYQTYTIPVNLAVGGAETIAITDVLQAYPSSETVAASTLVNSITFNASNQLVIDVANVLQNQKAMNKLMVNALMTNTNTFKTIFFDQGINWFRSAGIVGGNFIDPTRVKVTSSTASSVTTKETMPYYDVLGTSMDITELTDLDLALGQNLNRPELASADVAADVIEGLKDILNGVASGVEDGSILVPADDIPRL